MTRRMEWLVMSLLAIVALVLVMRTAPGREPFPTEAEVPSSTTILRKAEAAAAMFGYDLRTLPVALRAENDRTLRLAFEMGVVERAWRLRTSSAHSVDYYARGTDRYRVTVDLAGRPLSFRVIPRGTDVMPPYQGSPSDQEAARTIATNSFTAYWLRSARVGSTGDYGFRLTADGVPERQGYRFEWTSSPDPSGHLAWKVTYLIQGSHVREFGLIAVPLEPLLRRERELGASYEALILSVAVLGILGLFYAFSLTLLNLRRARIPWLFVARALVAVAALLVLHYVLGGGYANLRAAVHGTVSYALGQGIAALAGVVLAASLLCAGRATRVAADFRRWLGMEDFLQLRWQKASVTRSFLAAFLVASVWLGISYGIAAMVPSVFIESLTVSAVVSRVPALDGVYAVRSMAMLAVVAFAIPLIRAQVASRPAQAILCVLAASLGSVLAAMVEFPLPLLLLEALLHGVLLVYAYRRHGVLAAILGGVLAEPFARAFVLFARGDLTLQAWGVAMLAGGALFFTVALFLDARNPNREEEQRLSEEEFEALKRENERRLVTRRESLLGEFALAQQAQQRMLPGHPPSLAGVQVASICVPAQQVGGDLYDYLQIADARWAFCVADVSGKGVSAALYMTMVKGLLSAAATGRADLLTVAKMLNDHIYRVMQRRNFVTMILAAIDPATRKLEVLRAGHPPLLHVRAEGSTEYVTPNGMGLGLAPPAIFDRRLGTAQVRLAPGDAAVLYSDGVTEAMNLAREEFGEDRLARVASEAVSGSAENIRDRILDAIRDFQAGVRAHDDITILVVKAMDGHVTRSLEG